MEERWNVSISGLVNGRRRKERRWSRRRGWAREGGHRNWRALEGYLRRHQSSFSTGSLYFDLEEREEGTRKLVCFDLQTYLRSGFSFFIDHAKRPVGGQGNEWTVLRNWRRRSGRIFKSYNPADGFIFVPSLFPRFQREEGIFSFLSPTSISLCRFPLSVPRDPREL